MDNTPKPDTPSNDPLLEGSDKTAGAPTDTSVSTTDNKPAPLLDTPKKHIEPIDEAGVRQALADDASANPEPDKPDTSTIYNEPAAPTEPDPQLAVQIPTPDHSSDDNATRHHSFMDTIRGLFGKHDK